MLRGTASMLLHPIQLIAFLSFARKNHVTQMQTDFEWNKNFILTRSIKVFLFVSKLKKARNALPKRDCIATNKHSKGALKNNPSMIYTSPKMSFLAGTSESRALKP